MLRRIWLKILLIIVNLIILGGNILPAARFEIPITGNNVPENPPVKLLSTLPSFNSFVESVSNGKPGIRGVYIPEVMAFSVIQQPKDQPGFVSAIPGVVTQFEMASSMGTIGLLAHNFLAGSYFDDTKLGDLISVVHGTGEVEQYKITSILEYQALEPNNVRTAFLDLKGQNQISADELFKMVYSGKPHLTLQTCIAKGQILSWGRLFVIAEPSEEK